MSTRSSSDDRMAKPNGRSASLTSSLSSSTDDRPHSYAPDSTLGEDRTSLDWEGMISEEEIPGIVLLLQRRQSLQSPRLITII